MTENEAASDSFSNPESSGYEESPGGPGMVKRNKGIIWSRDPVKLRQFLYVSDLEG